jgi:hypothetical protein
MGSQITATHFLTLGTRDECELPVPTEYDCGLTGLDISKKTSIYSPSLKFNDCSVIDPVT